MIDSLPATITDIARAPQQFREKRCDANHELRLALQKYPALLRAIQHLRLAEHTGYALGEPEVVEHCRAAIEDILWFVRQREVL